MGKLFGTDGIRGVAGKDLDSTLAMNVGSAAAYVLGKNKKNINVLVGRDTRNSGDMLTHAITTGLLNYGAHVIDLGVIPTPAISYLVKFYGATMGVMISASHNPYMDNGIKLFNSDGFKLADSIEEEIEKYLLGKELPKSEVFGSYEYSDKGINDYVYHIIKCSKQFNPNLKIVVDCANGAASVTAPLIFNKLGYKPIFINSNYDGFNINKDAGSTHLEGLISKVKEEKADIGIAYDGDADRCMLVDEKGNVIDGDYIMAIAGKHLKEQGRLEGNTIVGTIMSNLGFRKFCEKEDIKFVATKVGDRYVLEYMLENKHILGGEQSGHIIFKHLANTGDGELTSIMILNIMVFENKSLSELASVMNSYPQVLVNVKVTKEGKTEYTEDTEVASKITEVETKLNGDGRVLIRASGTENLVRVMIEGKSQEEITEYANKIAKLIDKKYGVE